MSLFALQLARTFGARVIATTSTEEKAARLRELGASAVVNRRAAPQWGAEVRRFTDGHGADHVVEVGGMASLAQSLDAVAMGGEIAWVGTPAAFAHYAAGGGFGKVVIRVGAGEEDA